MMFFVLQINKFLGFARDHYLQNDKKNFNAANKEFLNGIAILFLYKKNVKKNSSKNMKIFCSFPPVIFPTDTLREFSLLCIMNFAC